MADEVQTKLRLPAAMSAWLKSEAERNLRSINGEVILAVREKMERQAAAETK